MTASSEKINIRTAAGKLIATIPTHRRAPDGTLIATTHAGILLRRRGRRRTEDLLVRSRHGTEEFYSFRRDGSDWAVPMDWLCDQVEAAAVGGYTEVILPHRFIANRD